MATTTWWCMRFGAERGTSSRSPSTGTTSWPRCIGPFASTSRLDGSSSGTRHWRPGPKSWSTWWRSSRLSSGRCPAGPTMSESSVLIVDDDLALLEALPEALRLRMRNVAVDTADSAAEALNRISQREYDAIVTDIKMPGMDGLELLAEI